MVTLSMGSCQLWATFSTGVAGVERGILKKVQRSGKTKKKAGGMFWRGRCTKLQKSHKITKIIQVKLEIQMQNLQPQKGGAGNERNIRRMKEYIAFDSKWSNGNHASPRGPWTRKPGRVCSPSTYSSTFPISSWRATFNFVTRDPFVSCQKETLVRYIMLYIMLRT